jgi:hypothetical protein
MMMGNLEEILKLEGEIQEKFEHHVQGELNHSLGIPYERDWEKGAISALQGDYIDVTTTSFSLEDATPVSSPPLPG